MWSTSRLGCAVGVGLAGRRGGRSGSGTGIAWLGLRGGVRWARGQANTVFQAFDLASNVWGVLIGLAADGGAGPAYVTHQSAIFDAPGRSHESQHALVLQPRSRPCEPNNLGAGLGGQTKLANRRSFNVLNQIRDRMSERLLLSPAWLCPLAEDGFGTSRKIGIVLCQCWDCSA